MPVQVFPSQIEAQPVKATFTKHARQFMQELGTGFGGRPPIQTSFDEEEEFPSNISPRNNGLVETVVQAYNKDHHLRIRPEDIWFAIMTQYSLYVKSHSKELRNKFVAHEGKKELILEYESLVDSQDFDFSVFARDMGFYLEHQVTDPDLRNWMMPAFSTTTDQDTIVASIIMMGTLEKYFTYICRSGCGIPSVTLLGERSDYVEILRRLDKLETFGREAEAFGVLLKPVLEGMIETFDNLTGASTLRFWKQIVDVNMGSRFCRYTGWIVAFCFWDEKGQCLHPAMKRTSFKAKDIRPHALDKDDVPPGWTTAAIQVIDQYRAFNAVMIAGSIGSPQQHGPHRESDASRTAVGNNEQLQPSARLPYSSQGFSATAPLSAQAAYPHHKGSYYSSDRQLQQSTDSDSTLCTLPPPIPYYTETGVRFPQHPDLIVFVTQRGSFTATSKPSISYTDVTAQSDVPLSAISHGRAHSQYGSAPPVPQYAGAVSPQHDPTPQYDAYQLVKQNQPPSIPLYASNPSSQNQPLSGMPHITTGISTLNIAAAKRQPTPPSEGYGMPWSQKAPDATKAVDDLGDAMSHKHTRKWDWWKIVCLIFRYPTYGIENLTDTYFQRFNKRLWKALKKGFVGEKARDLVKGILLAPLKQDVRACRHALKGMGTNERMLNSAVVARTNADLNTIKAAYKAKHGKELSLRISEDLSGNTRRVFDKILAAERAEESEPVVPEQIEKDVMDLYRSTEGRKGSDELLVAEILVPRNPDQIRAIAEAYEKRWAIRLPEMIRKECRGHMRETFLDIIGAATDSITRDMENLKASRFDRAFIHLLIKFHWDPEHVKKVVAALETSQGYTFDALLKKDFEAEGAGFQNWIKLVAWQDV